MRLETFNHSQLSEAQVHMDFGPRVQRPCECGCDERSGPSVGYLQMSRKGIGFVIHAETEDEFQLLREVAQ